MQRNPYAGYFDRNQSSDMNRDSTYSTYYQTQTPSQTTNVYPYQIPSGGNTAQSSLSQSNGNSGVVYNQNTQKTENNSYAYQQLYNTQSASSVYPNYQYSNVYQASTNSFEGKPFGKQFQALQNRIHSFLQMNNDKLSAEILNQALYQLSSINSVPQSEGQLLDLYLTINSVYKICADRRHLQNTIKEFFATRENYLSGDSNDYCYTQSLANQFCYKLAKLVFPNKPLMNVLLDNALTKNRQRPWQDVTTLESDIESPSCFFRTRDNSIHLYEAVVNRALSNLGRGQVKLNQIWFGTDEKNLKPLNQEERNILKQRSSVLKQVVDYTERLENQTGTICKHFDDLRSGLVAGDEDHEGETNAAGTKAYIAVSNFYDWWNDLSKSRKGQEIQLQIRKIPELVNFIKVLSVSKNECVQVLRNHLDSVYGDDTVRNQLRAIDKDPHSYLSDEELEFLHLKITQELPTVQEIKINANRFRDLANSISFKEAFMRSADTMTYDNLPQFSLNNTRSVNTNKITRDHQHDNHRGNLTVIPPAPPMPPAQTVYYPDNSELEINSQEKRGHHMHRFFRHLFGRHEENVIPTHGIVYGRGTH